MAKKKKQIKSLPVWTKYTWWLIPLLAVIVYLPSFNAEFTLDDNQIIENNNLVHSLSQLPTLWKTDYWAGKIDANDKSLYRPLTMTTYAIQYAIHKAHPAPYHILNILLHALVCFVLMKWVNLLFKDFWLTGLSGLLFAIHPIHTEAVSGIVGRAEILSGLFILTACISYHHWRETGKTKWLAFLLLSTFAAITSKEHGFMLPLILIMQEGVYFFQLKKNPVHRKRFYSGVGSVSLIAVILWGIRSTITGPPVPHEQWLGVAASDRMATSIRTTMEYVAMHVLPIRLSADYWTDEVPIVGFGSLEIIISFLMIAALIGLAFWLRKKMISVSWGILFFFLTLLPVSNFLFAAGFLKAERILYIPSIGLIIAMAALLVSLSKKTEVKWIGFCLIGILTLFFSVRTWLRAGDWKSNFTLAEATLRTSPNSPRFNNMMGLELVHQKRNKEALDYYEKAVKANPNHVPALVNLGTEYKNFNRNEEAIATLQRAIQIDPKAMMAYVNLMSVYRSLGDYDKNLEIAIKAMELFPNSAPVLWNAANAYQLKHNMEKANELRAKAVQIQPDIGGNQ
jgi:cytochrome c-type biogenesis protein CcmH/NrfG